MAVLLEHLPVQDEFYHDKSPTIAFVGGLGTGKTMTATDKIITILAKYARVSPIGDPSIYIMSNTYDQLTSGTLSTFRQRLEDVWIPGDARFEYKDRTRFNKCIEFPKLNACIGVRSVDQPINFKSLEICTLWLDEVQYWPKTAIDLCIGRRRGTARQRQLFPDYPIQAFMTANPPHSRSHWLYAATHENNPLTGEPPIKLYTATSYDNPFIPDLYLREMEGLYDPEIAEAELLGRFIDIGRGKVFRRFDRDKHVLTPEKAKKIGLPSLDIDNSLPMHISCDFNLDPLTCIIYQWRRVNVNGYQKKVIFVYDAIRIESAVISDMAQEFARRPAASIARRNGLIMAGDASGNARSRQTGESDWTALRMEFTRLGFRGESVVPPANLLHVDSAAASNRQLEDSTGSLGVVIVENQNTKWLVLDLDRLMWKLGTTTFEVMKPKPGEVLPQASKLTHLGDCFRYAVDVVNPMSEPHRPALIPAR